MRDLANQKYVICPAWPYLNAPAPHLGTVLQLLGADIYVRYLKLRGADVISATGSDCHGTPIEVAAMKEGISPKELVDRNHEIILDLLAKWNIELNYTKTENAFHYQWVQDFYNKCYENGYIFDKDVQQLYCKQDKRFLPDRFVEGTCPHCNAAGARGDQCDAPECGKPLNPVELIDPLCKICGKPPVVKSTKQWYYDFSAFQEKLSVYIRQNKQLPENARKFSNHILEEGVQARTLTRDLDWGIPADKAIPGAEGKSIYVWLEAVLGYVSASAELGIKLYNDPDYWKKYWLDQETKTIFFIGKDNIFFHTLLFPGLLLGVEERYGKPFVLPYNVSTTEFILFDEQKFSKSQSVGINIDDAATLLPTDYWRYFIAATRPEIKDTNFTWEDFEQRINTDLNDVLGNYIHRIFVLLHRFFEGKIPECHRTKEPWKLIDTDLSAVETTLSLCTQSLRTLAIIFSPIIPETSEKIWKTLNLDGTASEQRLDEAGKLILQPGRVVKESTPLFSKIDGEELRVQLHNLNKIKILEKTEEKVVSGQEQSIIPFKDFQKLDIRIGTITSAEKVPKADKLLKLKVDLGSEIGERQLVAGIATHRNIDDLIGKKITVIVNLEPATIRGIRSEGMLLAAVKGKKLGLITPDTDIPNGSRVS
ncbi:MAG: methionine--tRNA ligase [Candidatus Hodarchaeales archaeon]